MVSYSYSELLFLSWSALEWLHSRIFSENAYIFFSTTRYVPYNMHHRRQLLSISHRSTITNCIVRCSICYVARVPSKVLSTPGTDHSVLPSASARRLLVLGTNAGFQIIPCTATSTTVVQCSPVHHSRHMPVQVAKSLGQNGGMAWELTRPRAISSAWSGNPGALVDEQHLSFPGTTVRSFKCC